MYFIYFAYLLLFSFTFSPTVTADDVRKLNETQKEAMREFVHQVLNLNGGISGNMSRDLAGDNAMQRKTTNRKNQFPKHMFELYEKYTLQDIEGEEVIRSIEPTKDFVPHFKDIIVFNMTCISQTEKIKTAYLHIHRRKLTQLAKTIAGRKIVPPPCRVRLFQILVNPQGGVHVADDKNLNDMERTKLRPLDSVLVTQVMRGGWHTIDISMALKEMFDSPSATPPAIFGVRFEGPKGKPISPQHFLKDMGGNITSSFILVHSEESDGAKIQNRANRKDGLSDNKIKLIADMLENIEKVTHIKKSNDQLENTADKKKIKKLKYFRTDPIRHERKYYRESKHKNKEKEKNSNDVLEMNHSIPTPGEGDIVELLDYDRVKKLNKLRRHNHKIINALNLRYDSGAKNIVEERATKSRHKKNENRGRRRSDGKQVDANEVKDGIRFRRSIDDDSTDDDEYQDNTMFQDNDMNSKLFVTPTKKDRELDSEDDMGDLSYDIKILSSLHFLGHGSYQTAVGHGYTIGLSQPTVSRFLQQVTEALIANLMDEAIRFPQTSQEKERVKAEFQAMYGMPGVLGAVDGTHVAIVSPPKDHPLHPAMRFYNRKGFYSLNCQVNTKNVEVLDKPCKVQELTVSFEEIGFDFVIAPKTFNAGICAGSCPKNEKVRSKKLKNKNEDLIEEFLHQDMNQFSSDKEEPCCVPNKMKSLPVLYYTSENTAVLKAFKDVIVESCICR